MRKLILVVALALVVPAAALATAPSHPSHPATPASSHASTTATTAQASQPATPTVMWVLRGTLSKYTPATATANGSISITVKSSNFDSSTLKNRTLTFATNSKTNVVLHEGKPIAANSDNGIVKVRAAKGSSATALTTKTAFEVIDQGAST